jgi:hypothetical protein
MTERLSEAILSGDEPAVMRALRASQSEHDKRAEAIRASVGNPPLTRECEIHSGQLQPFSPADSEAWRRPRYGDCPECKREAEILAPKFHTWRDHGLPAVYFGVTLDELDFSEDMRAVLDEFKRERIGLLALLGNAGTGKTSAACAILQTRNRGQYATRADAVSELRATYTSTRGGPTGNGLKRRLIESPLLVLDEFEKVDGGGDGQRLLFELIDGRYREGRPTVICGNCSLAAFRNIIGDPGYSRVTGSGGVVLEFTGRDRRPDGRRRYAQQVALIRRLEKLGKD